MSIVITKVILKYKYAQNDKNTWKKANETNHSQKISTSEECIKKVIQYKKKVSSKT